MNGGKVGTAVANTKGDVSRAGANGSNGNDGKAGSDGTGGGGHTGSSTERDGGGGGGDSWTHQATLDSRTVDSSLILGSSYDRGYRAIVLTFNFASNELRNLLSFRPVFRFML